MPRLDTIGGVFAETAHRYARSVAVHAVGGGATWGELAARVRHLTLGLAEAGVGSGDEAVVAVPESAERRAALAAMASLGAVAVPATVAAARRVGQDDLGLDALTAAGAAADEADPSRFERLVAAVSCDDRATVLGDETYTHAALLVAARSLAQATAAGAGDRIVCAVPADTPTGLVAGHLVPLLTAASTWLPRDLSLPAAVAEARPTILVTTAAEGAELADALSLPPRWRPRRALATAGLDECRVVLVADGAPDAVAERLRDRGLPARAALVVDGHAGPVTGDDDGRPLPGVTLAADDDGSLLVRSDALAVGRCDDGWLRTGRAMAA